MTAWSRGTACQRRRKSHATTRVLPGTVPDRGVRELHHPALLVLADGLVLDLVENTELLPLDEGGRARATARDRPEAAGDAMRQLDLALEEELAAAGGVERHDEARVGASAVPYRIDAKRVAALRGAAGREEVARSQTGPHPLRKEHGQAAHLLRVRDELPELVRDVDLRRRGGSEGRHGDRHQGDDCDEGCDRTADGGLLGVERAVRTCLPAPTPPTPPRPHRRRALPRPGSHRLVGALL